MPRRRAVGATQPSPSRSTCGKPSRVARRNASCAGPRPTGGLCRSAPLVFALWWLHSHALLLYSRSWQPCPGSLPGAGIAAADPSASGSRSPAPPALCEWIFVHAWFRRRHPPASSPTRHSAKTRTPPRAHRHWSIVGDGVWRQPSVAPAKKFGFTSKPANDGNPGAEGGTISAAEPAHFEPFSCPLAGARGHPHRFTGREPGPVKRQFRDAVLFCARRARRPRDPLETKRHSRGQSLRAGGTHARSKPSRVSRKARAPNARGWSGQSRVCPEPPAEPAFPGFHGPSFGQLKADRYLSRGQRRRTQSPSARQKRPETRIPETPCSGRNTKHGPSAATRPATRLRRPLDLARNFVRLRAYIGRLRRASGN